MSLNTLLMAQESILNRYLKLDPEATKRLVLLAGRTLKIEWTLMTYYCLFKVDSILLTKDHVGFTDLIIRGSTFDFVQVFIHKERALTATTLKFFGDMEFAYQVKEFFFNLTIDWEGQLARFFGDDTAYLFNFSLKKMMRWVKEGMREVNENIRDYLQIERRYLVSSEELEDFFSEVDTLRDDSERLEAWMYALQTRTI